MARKAVLDTYYTWSPSTRTIVVPRAIPRERIALITDVTTNQVLYNFSDSTLTFSSYVIATSADGATTTTTMVLNYNTTNLSANDKIQIMVDEYDEKMTPSETYIDAANKLRVGTPQSLIDTDFEYSTQATKWEALALVNNRPLASFNPAVNFLTFSDIQATPQSRTYTVFTPTPAPANGSPIVVQDTFFPGADGVYVVDNANSTAFTYTGRFPYPATSAASIYNNGTTTIYTTNYISYSNIPIATIANTTVAGNTILVTCSQNHGLAIGNEIALMGTTQAAGGNSINGSWVVGTVPNTSSFYFQSANLVGGAISTISTGVAVLTVNSFGVSVTSTSGLAVGQIVIGTGIPTAPPTYITSIANSTFYTISQTPTVAGSPTVTYLATLYVRPQGMSVHRPGDGGLKFSVNSPSHNGQMIRQTRRAFRYQSGKAIQISTGTLLKPNIQIDSLTSVGTTATVVSKDAHNLTPAAYVSITGASYANGSADAAYNVTNTQVTSVITPYSFTYTTNGTPVSNAAYGTYTGSVVGWWGGSTRVGIFDNQNGMFFEFDGQNVNAVRRHSTYRLSGEAFVQQGNNVIVANTQITNTNWTNQVLAGDYIVIKGQSYRVLTVANSSYMTINPAYRGQTINSAQINKTIDIKYPQSQWNIDRMDGTGPSGGKLDFSKMQMFYIDYSWYGAGFIRYGVRTADGNIQYAHKIINNNTNYQAYMRSGNLPGRYETNTFAKTTYITANVNQFDVTVTVANTAGFPPAGTILVRSAIGDAQEYMTYSSINAVSQQFNLTSRAQPGNNNLSVGTTNNSPIITISSNSGLQAGQFIFASGIPPQTTIYSVGPTTATLTYAATLTNASVPAIVMPMGISTNNALFVANSAAPVIVESHAPQYASEISHWGTSAIMDGGFTPDKSFIFQKAMTVPVQIPGGNTYAIMSIRVAPSASQSAPGAGIGAREIINRMQLILHDSDVYAVSPVYVQYVLNGQLSANSPNWTNVGGSSLTQYIFHNSASPTIVTGGETIYGTYLNSAGGNNFTITSSDLTGVRDLGNSVLGGGYNSSTIGVYPDGPDVLTVVATNLTSTPTNTYVRIAWTEAQA